HDGAAADLAAAGGGALHAAIVAPFAGVVHVRLALLEQLAVAGEGIDVLGIGDVALDLLLHALLAIGPFDREAFLGKQALVIGDELGQALEGGGGLQDELLHADAPRALGSRWADAMIASLPNQGSPLEPSAAQSRRKHGSVDQALGSRRAARDFGS